MAQMIDVDFAKANQMAQRMEEIARDVKRNAADRMRTCIDETSTIWKGENANMFQNKASSGVDEVLESYKQLMRTADMIRRIAKTIHDAEAKATQAASVIR
ncbi:MAG: hypothetical protein IJP92_06625 [Lachnospiraceae bacterium]|nr:hypothetical protein [Lachnospiraceae bacterium]